MVGNTWAWFLARRGIASISVTGKICGLEWGPGKAGQLLPAKAWPSHPDRAVDWAAAQTRADGKRLSSASRLQWLPWQPADCMWLSCLISPALPMGLGGSRRFAREAHELNPLICCICCSVCCHPRYSYFVYKSEDMGLFQKKKKKTANFYDFLWLMGSWRKVFCRKFTNWKVFVSEYQQCFKNALQQQCYKLMHSIDHPLLDRKWKQTNKTKPFLWSQMGIIMRFHFQNVWLLMFERYYNVTYKS